MRPIEYGGMRLTNVSHMSLPHGRVLSYEARTSGESLRRLPISFDQDRHVGAGQRAGSWMAMAWRVPVTTDPEHVAHAWDAVVARHGSLRTVFSVDEHGLALHETDVLPGSWVEHPVTTGESARDVLREIFDAACAPFEQPSHRLAMVVTASDLWDQRPTLVLAADHAHVDMWSLLVLVRDLTACLDDIAAGVEPGAGLPAAATFADHTRALLERPPAPPEVEQRWADILAAEGGVMPRFALPLGDLDPRPEGVVEIRDVLDAEATDRLSHRAHAQGVRMIAVATSVLARVTQDLAGRPFRAVFPVHSRYENRWQDACGWFITNSVLESADPDPGACATAVQEAIELGSWPLAPILAPYGGMPEAPGMMAMSWLDARRLPVKVVAEAEVQFVSAAIRTDGVMIWFIVNDHGLHLRCRYPDTPEARENVGRWLDAVEDGLRAEAGPPGR